MNYKKIVFVLVIFIFLFSVSGAYAGDVADAAVASEDVGIDLTTTQNDVKTIENEQMLNVTDNSEVLSASDDGETVVAENDLDVLGDSQGTYSDLAGEIASGGTLIELAHDYYTCHELNTIVINHVCVIDGKGAVIDMAGSNIQTFKVEADGVIFKNLTIINANHTLDSAGIHFEKSGALINCNFINNVAVMGNGGAVYFNGKGEVTNCNFTNNTAECLSSSTYGNLGDCGAVYFNSNGTVTNCNFVNNKATGPDGWGGAVYFNGKGEVTNCNFTDNSALIAGGIYFASSGTVENCNFTNNSALGYYSGGINLNLGGAVLFKGKGDVINCNFVDNSANYDGGAVYFGSSGTVENCNFTDNSANNGGGAVFFYRTGNVINCNFTDNSANNGGGAVFFYRTGNVINCNFVDNKATASGSSGGAVYFYGSGSVENCNFSKNAGAAEGGAVHFNSTGTVSNCNFANNTAEQQGGAAFFNGAGNVTNCNFVDNKVTATYSNGGGSAIYWKGSNGIVSDCIFENNHANSEGGAIFWLGSNGAVSDCIFENNLANIEGGAIWWQASNGVVSGCSFVNNSATTNGGAVRWSNNNGVISGCVFVNNSAESGTIYFLNNRITSFDLGRNLTINDNIFLNNDASAINFFRDDSTSNADYNWFGHNATNYSVKPVFANVTINNWLFLNATANIRYIQDPSDIVFKLYAYAPSEVSEYDNNRLKNVNLTLTPTNGRINTTKTGLGESVQYTAESIGMGKLTASIENAVYTKTLLITDGTTFFDLNEAINGNNNDTIILDKDYTYNPAVDNDFKRGILINRPVTIIGNNHTINAAEQARIFNIRTDDVTVKNLTFENAKTTEFGGAIYWDGDNGDISDCVFVNNCADYSSPLDGTHGGAIYWYGDNGNVSDCVFEHNFASNLGGAIYWEGANGNVSGCVFEDNTADSKGGAIYWWQGSNDCVVSDCVFEDNHADREGGAVFFENSDRTAVSNCSFVNNFASNGGAVKWENSNGKVADCVFKDNSANDNGGAIWWSAGDGAAVSGCVFEDNSANDNGGAIYWNVNNGNVSDCVFANNFINVLDGNGGAVFWEGSNGVISVCAFVNNSADENIIYFHNGDSGRNLTINDNIFLNNEGVAISFDKTDSTSKVDGNWFGNNATDYNINPTLNNVEIDNWLFLNATSTPYAVPISGKFNITFKLYVYDSRGVSEYDKNRLREFNLTLTSTKGTINVTEIRPGESVEYTAVSSGIGTLTASIENAAYTVPLIISDGNTFFDLNRTINGNENDIVVLDKNYTYNSTIDHYNFKDGVVINRPLTIIGNNYTIDGFQQARIFNIQSDNVIVKNITFINANATGNGGAVYWNGVNGIVSDCVFENNYAQDKGGAVYWNGANGNVSDCAFVNNSAEYGGAVYWNGVNGIVSDCAFVNNSAEYGGAVYWNGVNGNVFDCAFVDGHATVDGGALCWDGANGNVSDCVFINNSAKDNAGVIKWSSNDNGVVSNCSFVNNSADNAAAIMLVDVTMCNVSDCVFVNNSAGQGGAIVGISSDCVISHCCFENNSGGQGISGAIWWLNIGRCVVSDCVFVNNSAGQGGAIAWGRSDGVISHCIFVNNSATGNYVGGGAVLWLDGHGGIVSDCVFVNNSATSNKGSGGAIYWQESAGGIVSDCVFENNSAGLNGGAVLWQDSHGGNVSGCVFKNNIISYDGGEGGAIMWSRSAGGAVSNCSFVNNSADNGGAIIWSLSDLGIVSGCAFVNNSASGSLGSTVFLDRSGNGVVSGCIFLNNSANNGVIYSYNMANAGRNFTINDNIFLNSNATAISFAMGDSSSNAEYNWFGDNATNCYAEPIVNNVIITNWLFLNATADLDSISLFQSYDVLFKLYSYNSTGISDYDNSQLYPINLTVTATKGNVDGIANLGETIRYDATSVGNGTVTAKFENAEYTLEINMVADPMLSVGSQEVSYSNNTVIALNYNSTATGKVNITLFGKKSHYSFVDLDINGTFSLGDIEVDEYDVLVEYSGDYSFINSTVTGNLTVIKANSTVAAVNIESDYEGYVVISVITEGADGVTAEIDGNAAKTISNVIFISDLNPGNHTLTVTTIPDRSHNAVTKTFNINTGQIKQNTSIELEVSSIENNATFTVTVDSNATGIVRFEVSGAEEYTVYVDVSNGKSVLENVLEIGDYSVAATYMGDSRFNSNSTSENFTIVGHVKIDTPITANADVNGYKVTVTVEVNESATGFVNMKFVDTEFNVALNNGIGSLTVDLPANSYNVDVTYLGDDNFNENMTKLTFTVVDPVKENTPIGLDVSSVENNATFTVTLNPDATGIVRFEVTGAEEYTVYADVLNGKAVMEDVLSVGDYTVVANYMGDSRFNSNITSESFTIKGHVKKNTPISADAKINGNLVTITVNVEENATGFVGLKQAGSTIYVAVENGVATYANKFEEGSYNVEVKYLGDDDYNENSTLLLFTVVEVAKENTTINLDVSSVEDYATFTVDVNPDATGIVRFEVTGAEEYTVYADVLNGKAVMEDILSVGDYTVVATYMGDSRFNSNLTSKTFNIKGHVKIDTPISANVNVNGYRVTVTVEVNESATGFVNMKFSDTEFNVALNNGIGSLTVDLPANSYNVDVTYLGDDNFNENKTKLAFTVIDPVKENTPIGLDVSSVENNATFTVTLNPDATGIVRFEVTGAEEYTVYADVLNGKAVMEDVLSVGDYEVVATYMGDARFNSNITSESFTIKGHIKKDTPISADAKINGNLVTITVTVDENATGFVGLKQAGSTIYVVVENGVATYANKFEAASYNVEVTYLGDDDFNENSTRLLFTVVEVTKENTPIGLDVSSTENNATFTVSVNPDATGIVRFEVSGAEEYTVYADVLNGKAVMEDVLSVGDYTVVATYMGDDRFNSNLTSKTFNIKGHVKIDTPISANVNVNGYKVTVTVEVNESATGFVNMKFGDTEFNVVLVDGVGSLTVNLPANSYNVDVTYLGDDNFNENKTKLAFTVVDPVKENTPISLDVSSIEDNATFTVNVNPDATGIVRFEVSGAEEYVVYADVVNGKAVMEDVLSVGDYAVVATYMGDSKFNSNVTSGNFTIKGHVKKDTPIRADAKVTGNRVTITINVNDDATGFIGLKLSGSTIYVALENGVAKYVNTFAAGSYNVAVTYLGDGDYNENSTRVLFTVVDTDKLNTPIDLNVSSVEDYVTFTVAVDSDATGIVRFEVSGAEEYTVYADVLNGKAVMEDILLAGNYTVVATYVGDENFNSNTTFMSFVVDKEPVIIPKASEFTEITIGDDLSINIVLKDETGNVIANAPITYVINGTAGTTTTAADGSFTIKGVNGAKVDIKYAGNETILPTNLTLTINVPDVPVVVKTDTHFNVSGNAITINGYAVDTKAGEKGIPYATALLDANGKPIKGAKIQFGVNNKIYKRTTNEKGSFTPYNLNMIRAGRYTMAFSFGGNDKYNSTFAVVCVDLDKKPITIKASAKTYKASVKTKKYTVTLKTIVGSSADGKAHLKSGKKVTLQVNGKKFSGKTNSKGQVTFKITNLNKKAKFKAKISYAGDITYKAATKTVTLTIK